MKKRAYAAIPLLAAALLLVPALAVAQQEPSTAQRPNEGGPYDNAGMNRPQPEPMITLTGMLHSDGEGGYTLVDQASGDTITLKKKARKLGEHDGSMVTVSGRWKGDESDKTFKVSKVEPAPASATESAAPSTSTSTSTTQPADTTQSTTPDTQSPDSTQTPETTPESTQSPDTTQSPDSSQTPDTSDSPDPQSPESPAPGTP